jgi:hypothetical protein
MYLFYVDESGQREYNTKSSHYFTLVAVGVAEGNWRSINAAINDIKLEYFGRADIEFKTHHLHRRELRERFYLKPHGLTPEMLTEAVNKLYNIIVDAPLTLFAAVINKRQMLSQYTTPEPATMLAYELLIERIEKFLGRCDDSPYGMIIHDLIVENAKSHQQDIHDLHEKFQSRGSTSAQKIERIIEGVHFVPSHHSNFLQIADMVAYNTARQFEDHGQEWDAKVAPDKMKQYEWFGRILPKFDKSAQNKVRGYGIKKMPSLPSGKVVLKEVEEK